MKRKLRGILSAMAMAAFAFLLMLPTSVKAANVSVSGTTLNVTGQGVVTKDDLAGISKDAITRIVIGEGITEIGSYVFEDYKNVSSVTFPSTLNKMGFYALAGCTSLKEVTIPKSVTEAGGYVFRDSGLETVNFEAGSTKVATLFQSATKLSKVNFVDTIESIDSYAFEDCTSLVSVKLPKNLKKIGFYGFKGTGIKEITIPKNLKEAGGYVFRDSALETVNFEAGSTKVATLFQSAPKLSKINWPNSIKVIDSYAFEDCKSLTKVVLPWYTEKVGFYAFKGCSSLKDVTIYQRVKEISDYAFRDDPSSMVIRGKKGSYAQAFAKKQKITFKNLTKIPALKGEKYVVGNVIYKVTDDTINGKGKVAVVGLNKNVASINIAGSVKLESYKYNVTEISAKAFNKKSSLKNIKISATGIKKMGKNAFAGINKNAVITVPASKYAAYKTMLKKAGLPKAAVIKKK